MERQLTPCPREYFLLNSHSYRQLRGRKQELKHSAPAKQKIVVILAQLRLFEKLNIFSRLIVTWNLTKRKEGREIGRKRATLNHSTVSVVLLFILRCPEALTVVVHSGPRVHFLFRWSLPFLEVVAIAGTGLQLFGKLLHSRKGQTKFHITSCSQQSCGASSSPCLCFMEIKLKNIPDVVGGGGVGKRLN